MLPVNLHLFQVKFMWLRPGDGKGPLLLVSDATPREDRMFIEEDVLYRNMTTKTSFPDSLPCIIFNMPYKF